MVMQIVSTEEKQQAKKAITRLLALRGAASRVELAASTGYSMPTVIQKVKELTEQGILEEIGEQKSRGGRRAKVLSLSRDAACALGINITQNHVELVLTGLNGDILGKCRLRKTFLAAPEYFEALGNIIKEFVEQRQDVLKKIIGTGISIPGILNPEKKYIVVSHALLLRNFSLKPFADVVPTPVIFENDANSAANSELQFRSSAAVYLSLNNTIGGAFSVDGRLYQGLNSKSSEFGHMILVPGGRKCYCGKRGCVDSYCAAAQLSQDDLEGFFRKLEQGDTTAEEKWREYVKYLGIVISNLRSIYDCDIILGGYVGGYLKPYLPEIEAAVMENNIFDLDASFVRFGKYTWEASAYGITLQVILDYLEKLE